MRKMVSIHIGNRRGLVHHIEMMISFTLFVFFVFFVIIFVKPQDNSFLGDSVVSGAHHNLLVQTQVDVVTFFVDVDILQSSGQECVQLDIPDELIDGIYNSSVSVGFLTDELKDTGLINNVDSATIGIRHGNVNDSYYIYLSNSF